MEKESMVRQMEALAQELEAVKQEYDFARGRASAHTRAALAGDHWAACFKEGVELRMIELEEIMKNIVESMAMLEQRYMHCMLKEVAAHGNL